MALWKITSAWEHELPPGSDCDFARSFTLTNGVREVQTTVEFARPSRRATRAKRGTRSLPTSTLRSRRHDGSS
jgi:hypothetical protein